MKASVKMFIAISSVFMVFKSYAVDSTFPEAGDFDMKKDLLLVQYDSKTDVDDLHSVAAFATFISNPQFSEVQYHAVAGTYGTQEGLYVPPNDLFRLAFGNNWTDANENFNKAVEKVKDIAMETLKSKGDIWIAEAGQSNFTAALIKAIQSDYLEINTSERIHVVQHSDWNERTTSPKDLQFVKNSAQYNKIPDGNEVGNGTPGFRDPSYTRWKEKIKNPKLIEIWQLASDLSERYNGKEGRYNNEAISSGGLDFSDFSEVFWIFGLQDVKDVEHFFNTYSI
ncbi:hypothetical protein [Autumnicola psychrophila]|uniref:DUF1593 domain-containing protein n=1 Tax=Autumnicola psychrophila TaxID=3075592 RepID=A0ABU3DVQ4_9FLAO|nr:hypothetical protein [Zunongwangia sp. F225]MDT0687760.1 hypothetical protein [Zunongwangia sp. F225]